MAFAIYIAFAVLYAVAAATNVLTIGKQRKPTTPALALASLAFGMLGFAGVTYLYFH